MKLNPATILAAMLLTLPLAMGPVSASAAQEEGECVGGRQIQRLIGDGQIMDLAEALASAGVEGKPLSEPELCNEGGQLVYHLNIINGQGEAERVVLNAQLN
jgi:uncharacterized membrane protein YkoI